MYFLTVECVARNLFIYFCVGDYETEAWWFGCQLGLVG